MSTDPFGLYETKDFGGSLGIEGHGMAGGGVDVNLCCSDKGKRWVVVTAKACLGVAAGLSFGPNVQGSNSKKNCPNGYAGFTFELAAGPFEGGIGIANNPIYAVGLTAGGIGKFTVCHYWIVYKKEIGCCEKGLWHQK